MITRKDIWQQAQNKPTLVVRDLADYAPADVVYESLLRRGVFKWLSVRRDLIALKDAWKAIVTQTISTLHAAKSTPHNTYEVAYWRGYLRAYEECRAQVRGLCHSERWRAPDCDAGAQAWLDMQRQDDTDA